MASSDVPRPISLGEIARRALEAHRASGQPPFQIDAAEFEEAQRDPRVHDFLARADRYLAENQ